MRRWIMQSVSAFSKLPPMWLEVSVFLLHVIQSAQLSSRKCPIFSWSISDNAFFNSFYALRKLLPLSDCITSKFHVSLPSFWEPEWRICVNLICYFNMDSTADQTCKHGSIYFEIWSLFPDKKWSEHVDTKISERWRFHYSFYC